jgi:hypothetical protein
VVPATTGNRLKLCCRQTNPADARRAACKINSAIHAIQLKSDLNRFTKQLSENRRIKMACKPFSIVLAVLAPDNKRQVSFAVTKGCLSDTQPFYVLNFVLRDKVNGGFQDRVRLHVTVGDTDNDKAQRLIDHGLTMTQLQFLQGPITTSAKALTPGTTADPATEKKLATLPSK